MDSAVAIDITQFPDRSNWGTKGIDINLLKDLRDKGLSYSQVAKVAGCSKTNVVLRLTGFNLDKDDVESFRENEADILSGLRHRIVKSITDEEIKKAPLGTKIMALGVSFDKEMDLTKGRVNTGTIQVTLNHVNAAVSDLAGLRSALESRGLNGSIGNRTIEISASNNTTLDVTESQSTPKTAPIPCVDALPALDTSPTSSTLPEQSVNHVAKKVDCKGGGRGGVRRF